jgi:hypothetical protein
MTALHFYGMRKITGQCTRSVLSYTGDFSSCFWPRQFESFSFRLILSCNVTYKLPWFYAESEGFQILMSRASAEHLIYAQTRCTMTPVSCESQFARSRWARQRLAG